MSKASEVLSSVKSGDNVFVHTAAAAPQALVNGLVERAPGLKDVNIYHLHTEGEAPYVNPEYEGIFNTNAFFIGANVRKAIREKRASYIPIFLSEVPSLFRRGIINLDVAMISVSPPDKHGYCSLGVSVDASLAAIQEAKTVVAQINSHMPRTHGEGIIHISNIDHFIEEDAPIHEAHIANISEVEQAIGKNVVELVEDGATLQMGIGAIPNAVLSYLGGHKNLGIHTEMFSDGILPLVEKGVINGSMKKKHPGKLTATFAVGTKKLYDFMDDNPVVVMLDCSYVNDTAVIRKNPKVTAINSAIEIDLTGQICADSIGHYMYSGVGGQMDFIRGASLSPGGKAIIALPSVTRRGESRIVPSLKEGAGVVTTRAHVHYVVTEWGIANLYGKSLKQRRKLLIDIAHPDHREALEEATFERPQVHPVAGS
ncbi:MAG: 4-hydroxybutyrate CoA-transferase [Cytophagales bacterium]|nr:4-hydroxybutyrate CoA-transferase [Cytophagales bacterium]